MSKYGSGYQVEGLRRKFGMEKSESTQQFRCPHQKGFFCNREIYPIKAKKGYGYTKRNCLPHQCSFYADYKEEELKKFRSEQRKKRNNIKL